MALVEAPSTAGALTVNSPELVAEVSSGIAVVDVPAAVVVVGNGSVSLVASPGAVGALFEVGPAAPPLVMTAGVEVSAVVLAGDGTTRSVDVPSSVGVELAVGGVLVEEVSTTGNGNVEVDTIGVVDADDVASEGGSSTRMGGVVVETGSDDVATVADEVAVSGDAATGDELVTIVEVPTSVRSTPSSTVDDDTSGVLSPEVVVVAASVDVATSANTRVTVTGAMESATKRTARPACVMR
jgi:hypothetical protein